MIPIPVEVNMAASVKLQLHVIPLLEIGSTDTLAHICLFTGAVFVIAKCQKPHKYPSLG